MPLPLKKIFQFKESNTAVLLGSGRSINEISDAAWQAIMAHDVWTVNNWVYHPTVVPNFYHVEAKWYNYELLRKRLAEKAKAYKDVKFVFPRRKAIKLMDGRRCPLHHLVPEGCKTFHYDMRPRDPKRTAQIFTAKYVMDNAYLTKSYDMSMTSIFELLYKFGYKRIVTYGIDLHNSYYFWTNRTDCGEVHHQTNKAHENKDPKAPHATAKILQFIIDFNRRWMRRSGREIFVGHKSTALYPYLKLKNWENEK